MERYQLLQTIYEISNQDSKPETYSCKPRELILRLMQDWSTIQQALTELEKEKLISTVQQDTLVIRITKEGILKVAELQSELRKK
jgi:Mn-dependent DtxR family transcriptional regulator